VKTPVRFIAAAQIGHTNLVVQRQICLYCWQWYAAQQCTENTTCLSIAKMVTRI